MLDFCESLRLWFFWFSPKTCTSLTHTLPFAPFPFRFLVHLCLLFVLTLGGSWAKLDISRHQAIKSEMFYQHGTLESPKRKRKWKVKGDEDRYRGTCGAAVAVHIRYATVLEQAYSHFAEFVCPERLRVFSLHSFQLKTGGTAGLRICYATLQRNLHSIVYSAVSDFQCIVRSSKLNVNLNWLGMKENSQA